MITKEKATKIIDNFLFTTNEYCDIVQAKQCAVIAIENEYYSLREQLFNLRSSGLIENDKVYLFRLQELIDEEKELKIEINRL